MPLIERVCAIRLDPRDNLLVARRHLALGDRLAEGIVTAEAVPPGHKVVARDIGPGEVLVRGGLPIGQAARVLSAGARLRPSDLLATVPVLPFRFPASSGPAAPAEATFEGFLREDGRVGTRNTVAVIVVGNCGATAARQAAEWFDEERLAAFPQVDAVVPYIHEIGCGMEMTGEPMDLLRRTLSGVIRHPNTAGAVVVALGCERNNLRSFLDQEELSVGERLQTVTIQELGGIRRAVEAARSLVEGMLPAADAARRRPVPASRLVLGLQGSAPDGFCGLSANPALGAAVDRLLAAGGTAILSETPELLPAGDALLARAATPVVAAALRERLDWWRTQGRGRGAPIDGAQAAAGLVSALERAQDGALKAGHAPLAEIRRYAERVEGPGLVFMDTPDHEPVSATGQIAGGATLLAMTTGRGTGFGSQPAPTVKIAASSEAFARRAEDTDLDAGPVLDGQLDVEAMGARIFDALLRHASGERTRGETEGMGLSEFVPWPVGVLA